jgi:hypothetical protein
MFYRRSFATVTSLLDFVTAYALPTFNTLLLQPDSVPSSVEIWFFFFHSNLCDIELDDTRRA